MLEQFAVGKFSYHEIIIITTVYCTRRNILCTYFLALPRPYREGVINLSLS